MFKIKSIISAAAIIITSLGLAPSASAVTVIDTISGANQGFYCLGVASNCGQTFGQTFTVGGDTRLDSFDFWTAPVQGGSVDVVFRLYEWSGSARTGVELFSSASTTLSNAIWAATSWNPGIVLTSGLQYMAYLDTTGLGNTTSQRSGFSSISDATYSGGTFLWERNVGDESWNVNGGDAEFRAVFNSVSQVPVPAALPLFGTGLALMGFFGWRRKRKAAA